MGESYETCGKIAYLGCPELTFDQHRKHDLKVIRCSCNRADCPICFEGWVTLEAHRTVERFEAADKQLGARASFKFIKHVVVSPPQGAYDAVGGFRKLRARAYRIARRAGLKGGQAIFHPFRWGADAWYWSPHFHMLGHGWIDETSELFESTGWVVKNLGLRSSLYQTVRYELSHAGLEGIQPYAKSRVRTITWWGQVSYAKLHVERVLERQTCSVCGRELVEMTFDSGFDPPLGTMQLTGEEARSHGLSASYERWQAI